MQSNMFFRWCGIYMCVHMCVSMSLCICVCVKNLYYGFCFSFQYPSSLPFEVSSLTEPVVTSSVRLPSWKTPEFFLSLSLQQKDYKEATLSRFLHESEDQIQVNCQIYLHHLSHLHRTFNRMFTSFYFCQIIS